MKPITVREIVEQYLRKNGYDGLCSAVCWCEVPPCDFSPLGDRCGTDCVASHFNSNQCMVPGPRPKRETKRERKVKR